MSGWLIAAALYLLGGVLVAAYEEKHPRGRWLGAALWPFVVVAVLVWHMADVLFGEWRS